MGRVLIVDDEKSIRITLKAFLQGDGYDVSVAETADEAIGLLKERQFDVVVTDIILPRITGVELLKSIRNVSPHSKVIMMTGVYKGRFGLEEAFDSGADYFITKPIDIDNLVKKIFELLKIDEEEFRKEFVKSSPDDES